MKKYLLFSILGGLCIAPLLVYAQASLVKDIFPGNDPSGGGEPVGLIPQNIIAANGIVYFAAEDDIHGNELWKSDGTAEGTAMVKDITLGINPSLINSDFEVTIIENLIFFRATNGEYGSELWKSDGTAEGTVLVKDIFPGYIQSGSIISLSSVPSELTNVNGTLFFNAEDGIHGRELWKSDGTAEGTILVKDINPGSNDSSPSALANVNGSLFFVADDGIHGRELWKSDGTEKGTVMVKDVNPGSNDSNPSEFANVNGTLFFSTDNGTNGFELWKSDGTEAGTVMVKDINPGSNDSSPSALTNVNGILFFSADNGTNGFELWKSDGTEAGTVMVKDINPGNTSGVFFGNLTNANGTLFFSADDGTHGFELWKSDGTEAGTVMVKDTRPGELNNSISSGPSALVNVNGTLFFRVDDGTHGQELWKSDGTEDGTMMVKDINPGNTSGVFFGNLTNANGTLFFSADDGTHGFELWKSDGTEAGTVMVKDIVFVNSSLPSNFTNVNGTVFFSANDGTHGQELWKSDGTEAGTVMVKDINPGGGSLPSNFTNVNGTLFFSANDGIHGEELWKSDGTETGTVMVRDIHPGGGSSPSDLTNVNGTLFFVANDGTYGFEIWKSDGTEAGTMLVKDIRPGLNNFRFQGPAKLINVNGTLFFNAIDGIHGRELWKSDGTETGTVMVKDIVTGSNSSAPGLLININVININGILFFEVTENQGGVELWKSDGTEEGTVMIKDFRPGFIRHHDQFFTAVNNTLFFVADDGIHGGEELWKSDGTPEGTVMVKDIHPGGSSRPAYLTVVNGLLYFFAVDGTHGDRLGGYELWRSDGTPEGTVLVNEVNDKILPTDANYTDLFAVENILYMKASSGSEGVELWRTDGTEEGTFLAADINPGPASSSIAFSTNVGNVLFFSANDGIHGRELWKYEETMQKQAVTSFTLVNADIDTDILELTEGMQLNINELPHARLNIRANTNPPTVGSVFLQLSGAVKASRKENTAPYTLFGDNKGNYNGRNLRLGDYTIRATPYTKANRKGEQGMSLSLNFSIKEEDTQKQTVTSFTLVNTDTDTDILELTEGMQLNINELPQAKLNIRANTNPPTVGSVFLQLSGAVKASRKENIAPYTLFGDNKGNYNGRKLKLGNYTISATPYSKTNLKGEQGKSLSHYFSIVDNQPPNVRIASEGDAHWGYETGGERLLSLPQKPWVYPNPFTQTFTVELSDFSGESVEVHLFDLYGKTLMTKNIPTTSGAIEVDVEHTIMGAGPYLLKLVWGDRVEVIKLIRKN